MSIHYNAFISYKHEAKDSRIADMIQSGLEHYKIPSKIQKSTGIKKINRIFRDKNELPITSDLTETISDALNNSDYLIVICSTKTKESIWVSREIEFFLRTHSKKQVLTVLVDGEPNDVIPQVLLQDEKTVYDTEGNPQKITIAIEPLSCDCRIPKSQAKRQELPRLVSALIGCSYDDLINRQRQYKIRQTMYIFAALTAVLAAFGIYMFHSRRVIQNNYINALKNQSRYLAKESENLMDNQRRLTALQLALAALPKDEKDPRPVISEAVRALARSTYAYVGKANSNIDIDCNYSMLSTINDFTVSPNGKYLAASDYNNNISVWNLQTHEQLLTYKAPSYSFFQNITFLPNDTVVYITTDENSIVKCFNPENQQESWSYDMGEESPDYNDIIIGEENIYIPLNNNKLLSLNYKDGALQDLYELPSNYLGEDVYIHNIKLSPDESKIAFSATKITEGYYVGYTDIGSGSPKFLEQKADYISKIQWTDNDHFAVSCSVFGDEQNMSMGNIKILSDSKSIIKYISIKDMKEEWTNELISNEPANNDGFMYFEESGSLVFYNGNCFKAIDIKNGKDIYSGDLNDSIIYAYKSAKGDIPCFITENGYISIPQFSDGQNSIYCNKYFVDDLQQAEVENGVICLQQSVSNEIISYSSEMYDDSWVAIDNGDVTLSGYPYDNYMDDSLLVYSTSSYDKLILTELNGDNYRSVSYPMDPDSLSSNSILGVYDKKLFITYFNDEQKLADIDLETGKLSETTFTDKYIGTSVPMFDIDSISYFSNNDDFEPAMFVYNIKTKETSEYSLLEDEAEATEGMSSVLYNKYFYMPGKDVVLYHSKSSCFVLNMKTKENTKVVVPEEWRQVEYCTALEDAGLFAVSDSTQVILIDTDGNIVSRIPTANGLPLGIGYFSTKKQKMLLVIGEDATLQRYSIPDGAFLGSTVLDKSLKNDFLYNDITINYDEASECMYLQVGSSTLVVDTNNWIEYYCVGNSLGYHEGSDRFITIWANGPEDYQLGYYKRYSLDELIEKAQSMLHDSELTDQQKSEYGIEYGD